jgi:hypothetical protein
MMTAPDLPGYVTVPNVWGFLALAFLAGAQVATFIWFMSQSSRDAKREADQRRLDKSREAALTRQLIAGLETRITALEDLVR